MKYVLFVCNHNAGRSQMAQAFFERYAPADIRGADQVLDRLGDARVRSHILTLANRQARECLRQNECEPVGAR